jgi:hypothetical protein
MYRMYRIERTVNNVPFLVNSWLTSLDAVNYAQKWYYDYKVTDCPAMTMTHSSELPNDSLEDNLWPMTMSLSHGILLTSLNNDVISGMHSPLPRDAMAERAMVVGTV